ncbi:MAG: hypothetical protein K2O59_13435 [Lachnospiraceae bacterium]|nr:hypothetical protein [Lachnospiraceae bacterium]
MMEKEIYGKIIGVNLKYNFLMPFASALGVLILTLVMFNITSLQGIEAARPIEFLLCFIGVTLLVPIFLPEQDDNIRDVVCSKKINYFNILLIRILYSVAAMILLITFFISLMKVCESQVTVQHLIGGVASAWLLGAVGFAAAGITNNVTVGYMAAMLYYLANYGMKDKVGKFFLFPMSYLGRFDESGWLIFGAVALMAITLGVCRKRGHAAARFKLTTR